MAKQNNNQGTLEQEQTLNQKEALLVKHKKAIIGVIIAAIVLVAAFLLYKNYVAKPHEDKASTALGKGQQYFAENDFEKALNGDGMGYAGFLKIASDYSGTDAGNLANALAGLSYAKQDKWQEAVNYLEKFDGADDQMISPAITAALGNCYAHLKQLDKAVDLLTKAAKKADNNSLSPTFLIQAGEILESQGKNAEALKLYQEVKEKYVNSMAYQTIDKYIERVSEK